MNFELSPIESRVLGALIEKSLATPEYYPLTLSALTAACNQKSNRDPVMSLGYDEVLEALESLTKLHLVWEKGGAGGRVPKYAHKLADTLTKAIDFPPRELAVLAVLLLRGPQTAGEIHTRCGRMADFTSLEQVEATLHTLVERQDGPWVVELPLERGRRERCYAHLFGGPVSAMVEPQEARSAPAGSGLAARVSNLEGKVDSLLAELEALKKALGG